jgi:CRISPR-associated Cas5-like protein
LAGKETDVGYGVKVRVWGDDACFTRPEMKAERVSYDVMTPSARGGSSKRSLEAGDPLGR